jgi:ADP-ribosylglycohydrolase
MLGVPVEFRTKSELMRRYPTGLRDIDARLRTTPWDDDLAQAVVLAEAASDGQ